MKGNILSSAIRHAMMVGLVVASLSASAGADTRRIRTTPSLVPAPPCNITDPAVATNPASLTGHWQQGWSIIGVAAGGAPGWATSWNWSDGVIFSGPIQNDPVRVQQFATALGAVGPSTLKGCVNTTWGTFKAYSNIPTLYTITDPAANLKYHWIVRAKLAPANLTCVKGERVQTRASHVNIEVTLPHTPESGAAVLYYNCL